MDKPSLPLPHERDQHESAAGRKPRQVMREAKQDLERGLVDTDLRATPGLDAPERERLLRREQANSEAEARATPAAPSTPPAPATRPAQAAPSPRPRPTPGRAARS